MKRLILIIVLLPLFVFSQNSNENIPKRISKLQLKDGNTFECIIQSFNKDSVTYSDVKGQDWKTISKNSISNVLKTDKIYQVIPKSKNFKIEKENSSNPFSAGDYLEQAGNDYLLGVGLVIGGGGATFLSTTNSDNKDLVYVGAGLALAGFVCTIVAHTKLIKAGKALNKNKSLSLHPSTSGLGLALKF